MTCGISHLDPDGRAILARGLDQGAATPLRPAERVDRFASIFQEYRISQVVGDKYAGETFSRTSPVRDPLPGRRRAGVRLVCRLRVEAQRRAGRPRRRRDGRAAVARARLARPEDHHPGSAAVRRDSALDPSRHRPPVSLVRGPRDPAPGAPEAVADLPRQPRRGAWRPRGRIPPRSRSPTSSAARPSRGSSPGASRRPDGRIEFQCPVCRDSSQDDAVLFAAGTYGCSRTTRLGPTTRRSRELFGPSPGTRQAGRLRAQVDGLIAELAQVPLPGRSGTTDTAVLLAHLAIIRRLGRWDHGASEREVADTGGAGSSGPKQVHESHRRLVRAGRLVRLARATYSRSTRWQVVPFRLPAPGRPTGRGFLGDKSVPEGGREDLIPYGNLSTQAPRSSPTTRSGTGPALGKGCGLAYVRLTTAPKDGLA